MPTRNVNLTGHYDDFVDNLITAGKFSNASEVMRAGLRLLEQQAREDEEKLNSLRSVAAGAFGALDQGQGIALDSQQQLAEYISQAGLRAAERAEHGTVNADSWPTT